MPEEAASHVSRAMQIASRIENPDSRLSQYSFALTELLVSKYDRQVIMALIHEMKELSDNRDSPWANEVKLRLPQTIRTWGLE